MKAAAERLVPCYLELGGKDPMVVCADADVERAANAASFYSMNNAGQVCISVERCYVEAPVYDEFVAKVTETVRGLRQGALDRARLGRRRRGDLPAAAGHRRGPRPDAVDKGAKVLTGGHGHSERGRFYEPTVLVDVDHTMKIMREETFGPTLPIMKIASAEEGDPAGQRLRLRAAGERLDQGPGSRRAAGAADPGRCRCASTTCRPTTLALNLPMGGWKSSGIGTRHGANGIRKYSKTQSLLVTRFGPKREPWMFPYKRALDDAAAAAVQGAVRPRQRD